MREVDPSQDPSAVPVSELQRWAESFWPGPGHQNQLPELTTGKDRWRGSVIMRLCIHMMHEIMCMKGRFLKQQLCLFVCLFFFYQSSMCVACATSGTAAGRRLLLLLQRWLVVVGVGEDQALGGRGGRWFSPSTHRLLQQRGEVQTNTQTESRVG